MPRSKQEPSPPVYWYRVTANVSSSRMMPVSEVKEWFTQRLLTDADDVMTLLNVVTPEFIDTIPPAR